MIELGPGFGSGLVFQLADGSGGPTADPKQMVEADAAGCCGFGIEGVRSVNPGADAILAGTAGDEGEGQAGSSGGDRASDFADGADRQAAFEHVVGCRNAGRRGFADGARGGCERGGKAAFEAVFDLDAKRGGRRHDYFAFSSLCSLVYDSVVKDRLWVRADEHIYQLLA